ncbi:transglutaminase domain-containing protein [bacterium]|nr:transglutaminase domain-containing protein [bacterium]
MRKYLFVMPFFLLSLSISLAQSPKSTIIQDNWDAAYLEGTRCGNFHSTVKEIVQPDGSKLFESRLEMQLMLKRYKSVVAMKMDTEMVEDQEGKIKSFRMIQHLDKGQAVQEGEVKDGKLWLKVPGVQEPRALNWNEKAIGVHKQEKLPMLMKAQPGTKFDYLNFEPSLMQTVRMQAELFPKEEVDYLETDKKNPSKATREKTGLMRYEVTPDKVTIFGSALQLPKMVSWVGDDFVPRRSVMELPGIGSIFLYRTTKEFAQKDDGDLAVLPDIGLNTMIVLDKKIRDVHHREEVTYQFKLESMEGASAFTVDGSDNMKGSSSVGFATAGQIAKDLQGDCRQHAMLMAAMCRAAGIPSRTALGLVYVEDSKTRTPQFGFHMWTEVYVQNAWVGMDATLGEGVVGPGHLKIADHNWHDQQTLAPLLPVIRVMGKVKIKVIDAR